MVARKLIAQLHCLAWTNHRASDTIDCMRIDIHQHLNFRGRKDVDFIQHQKDMGIDLTMLLPASGSKAHDNGLQVGVPGTEAAYQFVQRTPGFLFAANAALEDLSMIADYIERGAKLIGELKFKAAGDSPVLWSYAEVAQEYNVPVLIHFAANSIRLTGFEATLRRFPSVNFIGHAGGWWTQREKEVDRLMSEHKNLYGDVSAYSGFEALSREGASEFVTRHQDRILFGSDCCDPSPWKSTRHSLRCVGTSIRERLEDILSPTILEKVLGANAKRLLKI